MSTQTPTFVPPPLTAPQAYSPEFWKDYYDKVVVDDGEPVDGQYSERAMRLLAGSLHTSWPGPGGDRPFCALANVGLFYSVHQPPIVPDVMLSLDVRPLPTSLGKRAQSYFIWEYGKTPDWVGEIVSNAKGGEDTRKLQVYQQIGIPYYVIYDPESFLGDKAVRVYYLDKGKYQLRDDMWFPKLNLGLTLWTGAFEGLNATYLRWADPQGNLILTGEEQADRAKKAQERAERLAAKLRELGIDPDNA